EGVREEGADLVLERRDRLGPEAGGVARVLAEPEGPHLRTLDPPDGVAAELVIREKPKDVGQGRLGLIEEGEEGVPEQMLEARPPGVGPEFFEHLEEARGGERPLRRRHAGERVEAERGAPVRDVEVHEIAFATRGDGLDEPLDEIAVWIEERE